MKLKKALSVDNITQSTFKTFEFTGEWEAMLNCPQASGVWFIWGNSGSGKSSFTMALAKNLCAFGNVLYNALEEYDTKSFKDRIIRFKMNEVKKNFNVACYTLEELIKRLELRRSPKIVIIDSESYFDWNFDTYVFLKNKFKTKTFIIIGHSSGKRPSNTTANKIMYDSYIKIWVEGYKAFSKGREIGTNGGIYTIWQEGAENYWGN